MKGSALEEIDLSVDKYNNERHLSHIRNVRLVKGDFNVTSEKYIENNQQTIISLLYLDFDLYEPTRKALELFLPIMPKGAIVAFDEINCESFPGETLALHEVVGINKYEIKRFPFEPWISGSAQESGEVCILRGFLESDEFGARGGQPLCFQ